MHVHTEVDFWVLYLSNEWISHDIFAISHDVFAQSVYRITSYKMHGLRTIYMYMLEDYSVVRECHAVWVSDLVHYKCRLMSD